jgi:hypothetical protein
MMKTVDIAWCAAVCGSRLLVVCAYHLLQQGHPVDVYDDLSFRVVIAPQENP